MPASMHHERLAKFHEMVDVKQTTVNTPIRENLVNGKTPVSEFLHEGLQMPIPLPPGWKVLRHFSSPKKNHGAVIKDVVKGETAQIRRARGEAIGLWCTDFTRGGALGARESSALVNAAYILVPDFYDPNGTPRFYDPNRNSSGNKDMVALREKYLAKYGEAQKQQFGQTFDQFLQHDIKSVPPFFAYPVISLGTTLVQLQPAEIKEQDGMPENRTFYVPEILAQVYFDEVMPETSV